jgi:hypothetical protein
MGKALVRVGILAAALLFTGVPVPGRSRASDSGGSEAADPKVQADRPTQPQTVTVPLVIDKPVAIASAAINNVGLMPITKMTVDRRHQPGIVTSQTPGAGTQVAAGTQVILNVAATEIAVQPGTTVDEATGRSRIWGQVIVHRAFTLGLKAQVQRVPLLAVAFQGRDYAPRDTLDPLHFAEARADTIAERLTLAWTLLDNGGTLVVSTDKASIWRLADPLGPQYGPPGIEPPAIQVCHPSLGNQPLNILTVYPEDARAFGQPNDAQGVPAPLTDRELADYLVALIQAHHLLFHKQATDPNSYDRLDICKTRDGRIFKEIAAQVRQAGSGETAGIEGVLEQMSVDQATRLSTLAYKAPPDWRLARKP